MRSALPSREAWLPRLLLVLFCLPRPHPLHLHPLRLQLLRSAAAARLQRHAYSARTAVTTAKQSFSLCRPLDRRCAAASCCPQPCLLRCGCRCISLSCSSAADRRAAPLFPPSVPSCAMPARSCSQTAEALSPHALSFISLCQPGLCRLRRRSPLAPSRSRRVSQSLCWLPPRCLLMRPPCHWASLPSRCSPAPVPRRRPLCPLTRCGLTPRIVWSCRSDAESTSRRNRRRLRRTRRGSSQSCPSCCATATSCWAPSFTASSGRS